MVVVVVAIDVVLLLGTTFSIEGENLVLRKAGGDLGAREATSPGGGKSVNGALDPGRCQSHAKPEAKQKVGVKVLASAAGGRAPPPCGRLACDEQVAPGGSGPVWFLSPGRSRSEDSVCVRPRRRAESSLGGAAPHFPAPKL